MFGSENVKALFYDISVDPTGEETFHLMKMPRAATIKAAYVVAENAQNAGTACLIAGENWGTAGTAVEGTVWASVGGTATASQLAAITPKAATINTDHDEFAQGEWLVLHFTEEGAGFIATDRFQVIVHYVDGKGA